MIDTNMLDKIKNSTHNIPKAMNGELFKEGRKYSIAVTLDSIRHLTDDKIALTKDDIIDYLDRLSDTILEFDSVNFDYYIRGENKSPGLLFKKIFPDDVLISFNLVSNKKKSLVLQTFYMDSASYQKKKSAETLLVQKAHNVTSKTQVGQTSNNSIIENSEKNNTFDENNSKNVSDERKSVKRSYEPGGESSKKITLGMSDAERAEILKGKKIVAPIYEGEADQVILENKEALNSYKASLVKNALINIGVSVDAFEKNYNIEDIDVKVQLSRGALKESVAKSASPEQIAKLLPKLKGVIENAIHIESHANRYYHDDTTISFDNLLGGFIVEDYFTPIRFGLKYGNDEKITLYVIVDQEKIKTEVLKAAELNESTPTTSRSANYSISQIIPFVNNKDVLRYLPDDMLNDEQKKAKWEAIAEGKTLGELFYQNDADMSQCLDVEFNKKNRVTAAQFASSEAIASTLRSPQFNSSINDNSQKNNTFDENNSKKYF